MYCIYMDYQATTPVDPRVAQLMHEVSLREFGNYHSRTHSYGWRAEKLVEDARAQIAQLVNAKPSEIVFTSGATESNNLALKGFGIGALYVRAKPRVRLVPQMHGGDQERGMLSGTLPVPLCVGFGEACRLSREEFARDVAHVRRLSERFVRNITSRLPAVRLNGGEANRYPGSCNLAFAGVEGESLIMAMKEIAVSSGSACTSASLEPSYVLRALGVDEELAHTSIRFSFGRFTTLAEVDRTADLVVEAVSKLRSISPLWDAHLSNSKPQTVWK
uniref:Uncharacterized protein LOC113795305 n=1 Tax=Dermatophagoides pteronyssinus TaxID=6956 RepID=A0A6P6Y8H6_DERPT|nr:uncharacterized protein LOC113795305 [Dermatophagoides pteronyssinus]